MTPLSLNSYNAYDFIKRYNVVILYETQRPLQSRFQPTYLTSRMVRQRDVNEYGVELDRVSGKREREKMINDIKARYRVFHT